jgi:hypothetical protein
VALHLISCGSLPQFDKGAVSGKQIGVFATLSGPPLEVFELELLFRPHEDRISAKGATVIDTLTISSQHHPFFFFGEMERIFQWIAKKPLTGS